MFVAAGADGSIKIFDIISGKLIKCISHAHGGASVSSAEFSKNGRYILSAGQDSLPRLWDVSNWKVVRTYKGTHHMVILHQNRIIIC